MARGVQARPEAHNAVRVGRTVPLKGSTSASSPLVDSQMRRLSTSATEKPPIQVSKSAPGREREERLENTAVARTESTDKSRSVRGLISANTCRGAVTV